MFAKYRVFIFLFVLQFCTFAIGAEITGAGSSAAKLLYAKWAEAYGRGVDVKLDYQPVGSSGGIKKIKERAADFGASDVALSPDELKRDKLICFPSAISGVVPVFNLPGIKAGELHLTGDVLADIFARKVTKWNDPAIAASNPGLTLPKTAIVVVARQDGSGTTYNFSDYLSKVSPAWKDAFGRNFTLAWPNEVVQVKGSGGIVTAVKQSVGAIGYVDYNYVVQDKLAYVKLRNRDGKFVAPTGDGFASALNNSTWKAKASFEEMLTDKPGQYTWPITMGTFVIVPQATATPQRTIATLKFFTWAFLHGDGIVDRMDFVQLPDRVQARIYNEMTKITDQSGTPLQWSLNK